jgi:tetratricopeptide (TPR) repeat protein
MMLGIVLLAIMGTGRRSVPACLFLTFIVSLLPVLQIVPLTIAGSIGAERFLAMPLAFLVFAVFSIEAVAVPAISARIQILSGRMLLAGWLLLAAGCLYVTLPLWRSDLTLWTWTYQQHPDSALLRQSYVVAAVRERDFDSAKKVFDQMLGGDGFDPVMQMIYGNYLIKISQDEEGIAYLQGAIAVFPRPDLHPEETLDEANYRYLAYGFSSLAVGYLDLHNFAEALTAARLSQWYRPFSDTSKLWESLALYGLGRQQDADAAFDQVLKWQPESEHPMMYEQRDKLLRSLSDSAAASSTPPSEIPSRNVSTFRPDSKK